MLVPKLKVGFGVFGCLGVFTFASLAILMPIFGSNDVSEQAELCKGNLVKLQRAAELYAEANGGRLPVSGWDQALAKYEGDEVAYSCPRQRRIDPRSSGYALNSRVSGKVLADLPKDTYIFFDADVLDHGRLADPDGMPNPGRHRRGMSNCASTASGTAVDVPAGHKPEGPPPKPQ